MVGRWGGGLGMGRLRGGWVCLGLGSGLGFLPFDHAVVDVLVGGEFVLLLGVLGDGGFEVVVGDAGGHEGEQAGEVGGIAQDAPGVIGAGVGLDRGGQADGLGQDFEIRPAAGANVHFIRAFADDGVEAELGAEPHVFFFSDQ